MRSMLISLFFLILAGAARATDGVLEMNHTCAVTTGCFAGDTAGYPVQITGAAGRSFRLTSDLILPNIDTHGIEVDAPGISIDLNGFQIARSSCQATGTNCTPATGTGSGVYAKFADIHGISVENGSITGMGSHGVQIQGAQAIVKGLRVRWNRLDGIHVGNGSIVSDNAATGNGEAGIFVLSSSTITGNTVFTNGMDGIKSGQGSTISGNTAWGNGADGVDAGFGCTVQGNTAQRNLGYGLRLSFSAAYRENVVTENTVGTVTGGMNMGANSCNGSVSCP